MTRRASGINTGHNGFTIVELLIVIVVIAILAAITVVAYTGITGRANDASVQTDLRQIATKLQAYAANNNGVYPQSDTEIQTLGIKVAKGAYGQHASSNGDQYNLLYCRPQADPNRFALVASSNGGTLFQLIDGTITSISRSTWDTNSPLSAALCSNAGIPTSGGQYWFYQASSWRSWL